MKKFLYLLLLLPLGLVSASCDDDNKVPDVGVQATLSGGVLTTTQSMSYRASHS